MNVTRADLRVTAVSIAVQMVAAVALSLLAGAIWSRFDGSPLLPRWSDALAIAGPVWLIASGTFASKTTVMSYMKVGHPRTQRDAVRRRHRPERRGGPHRLR